MELGNWESLPFFLVLTLYNWSIMKQYKCAFHYITPVDCFLQQWATKVCPCLNEASHLTRVLTWQGTSSPAHSQYLRMWVCSSVMWNRSKHGMLEYLTSFLFADNVVCLCTRAAEKGLGRSRWSSCPWRSPSACSSPSRRTPPSSSFDWGWSGCQCWARWHLTGARLLDCFDFASPFLFLPLQFHHFCVSVRFLLLFPHRWAFHNPLMRCRDSSTETAKQIQFSFTKNYGLIF